MLPQGEAGWRVQGCSVLFLLQLFVGSRVISTHVSILSHLPHLPICEAAGGSSFVLWIQAGQISSLKSLRGPRPGTWVPLPKVTPGRPLTRKPARPSSHVGRQGGEGRVREVFAVLRRGKLNIWENICNWFSHWSKQWCKTSCGVLNTNSGLVYEISGPMHLKEWTSFPLGEFRLYYSFNGWLWAHYISPLSISSFLGKWVCWED